MHYFKGQNQTSPTNKICRNNKNHLRESRNLASKKKFKKSRKFTLYFKDTTQKPLPLLHETPM